MVRVVIQVHPQPITAQCNPVQHRTAHWRSVHQEQPRPSGIIMPHLIICVLVLSSFFSKKFWITPAANWVYHALCPWFSFQFQSCRPFSNNLFLFFLLFNRRWTHLSLVCILANAIFYILAPMRYVVFLLVPYFLWWKFTGLSDESHCYPLEDRNQPLAIAFVYVFVSPCLCLYLFLFVFVFIYLCFYLS